MNSSGTVLEELPVEDPIEEDDTVVPNIRYHITSYGADLTVREIVRLLEKSTIYIPPFQRKFVWSQAQSSRFIESLILDLPVPGIFLFKEAETRRLMVIDGQQRLRSIAKFYQGTFGHRKFRLWGVSEAFHKKTYRTLSPDSRRYLDHSIIHATISQQDEPSADQSSVYSIFERLNTGSRQLQPQEIRACVYSGKLNDLLSELAKNDHWKLIYRSSSSRKKDEEIILRFLALLFARSEYQPPMKQFLNGFMAKYRNAGACKMESFRREFESVIEIVDTILKPKALRPERALNVALVDAVLIGLAHRLKKGPVTDINALIAANKRVVSLLQDEGLITTGTTSKDRVERRIDLA